MKILVIGSGGREHALVWKISQSKLVSKIFCAPGNGGIAQLAECVNIAVDDVPQLLSFAKKNSIDLTVVGPEVSLAAGVSDEFSRAGLLVFGPSQAATKLESSKVFAKQIMMRSGVPTAEFRTFNDYDEARKHVSMRGAPCVIKADGLAQGKGVVVAATVQEALAAVDAMMLRKDFGIAGNRIIVEECLSGQEASLLAFTDSRTIIPLVSSQDHKRIFDNDQGPNTGGMGAYSPAPIVTKDVSDFALKKIFAPIIAGLKKEGIEYRGLLYAGIMISPSGVKVLEFNVRFGDPETQAILPRLQSDIVEVMLAVAKGNLSKIKSLDWDTRACVCVVCAAKGYPGSYEKEKEINGIQDAQNIPGVHVFHAGTRVSDAGKYFTTGGRVLGVTALGENISGAIAAVYHGVSKINFDGMQYRKDIGRKAL